jgi:opacity protein-like surface antigen
MQKAIVGLAVITGLTLGAGAAEASQYLRIGAVWEDSRSATFLDRNCEPTERAALFGCDDGDDGLPIGARGDFGRGTGAQLGWGVHLGEMWRTELELTYQPGLEFQGNSNFIDTGEMQPASGSLTQYRAGVNVYLDLAAALARDAGTFEPYLGAGASAVRNRISTMRYEFPELESQPAETTVPGGSSNHLGWMVTLGTGIELSPRNLIDIGISWNDHGRVETPVGEIDIIRSGESVAQVEVESTRSRLETVGLMLSWRHYLR